MSDYCPYCSHDLEPAMEALNIQRHPQALAMLCPECGEPLLYDDIEDDGTFTVRRPNDDEMVMLYEKTSIRQAREAWAIARERQRRQQPPIIEQTWRIYRGLMLKNEHDEDYVTSHRKAYFAGAIAMAATIRQLGADLDRDTFNAYMDLIHAELDSIDVELKQAKHGG